MPTKPCAGISPITRAEVTQKVEMEVTFDRQAAIAELQRIERDMDLAQGSLAGTSGLKLAEDRQQLTSDAAGRGENRTSVNFLAGAPTVTVAGG
jgi:hypothetical protein